MKMKINYVLLLSLTGLIQACVLHDANTLYQPVGKTAELNIDVPSIYEPSIAVLNDTHVKSIAGNVSNLIYGSYDSMTQIDTQVKVTANKLLSLHVNYDLSPTEYCDLHALFTPEANKFYRLTVGVVRDENKGTFINNLFSVRSGKCYVSVSQIVNGKYIPVKLRG